MEDVRELVDKKRRLLQTLGYRVIEMWECSWEAHKQSNPDIADYVTLLDLQTPLNPRDAFYGGRTNAVRLHVYTPKIKQKSDPLRRLHIVVSLG